MIWAIKWTLASLTFFTGSIFLLILSLLRPMNPAVAMMWSRYVPPICLKFLGVRLEIRHHDFVKKGHPGVLVANHQHALDLFTCSQVLITPTVAVGKRELIWIPIFGPLFYLTGQIMINRSFHVSAMESMNQAADIAVKRKVSVWMFPEGTRSQGKPLQRFKRGAFHLAIRSQIPIIPVCVSSYHKNINLKHLKSGTVIIDILEPISTLGKTASDVDSLVAECHKKMSHRINELDTEISQGIKASTTVFAEPSS